MWRPLLTATFPSPSQGLHAFRKLREFRVLHEHNWEHPDPQARKLPTKKERSHIIMDQKANSIADLAHVLRQQEELGLKKQQHQEAHQNRIREELLALAKEAEEGGIPLLQESVKAQEDALRNMKQMKLDGNPDAPTRKVIGENMLAFKTMRLKLQKMIAADQAINQAKDNAVRQSEAQEARGTATPDSVDLTIEPPEIFYHPTPGTAPKKSNDVPLYTADGVVIRWTNPLDAEFAESWPQAVRHEAAGLSRHTAARVDEEPVFATEDYIMRNTSYKYQALRDARAEQLEALDSEANSADVSPELLEQSTAAQPTTRA